MSVEADIADRPCECEKDDPPESLADAPATKKVERAGVTLKSIARILCETPVFTPSQLELAIHVAVRYRWPAGIWLSRLMPPGLLDRHGGVLEPAGASIDVAEIARRWPGAEPITAALRNGGSVSPELLATHLSADDQADFVEVAVSVGLATVVPGTLPPADAIWAELQRPAATTPPQSVSASELPATGKGGDVDAEILAPSAALDKNTRRTLSSLFADLTQQRAGVFLLHGEPPEVQLCLQLARCCKSLRRQVVIVLPDVRGVRRLTTALASLLPPGSVATYHSKLRIAERREVWRSMLCGRPNVIVGTQAALLAPLQRLGAIVVLDEHSHVYKSERMPRYHARDIALWLGRQRRATLLLVSPTPDPVTLWNARRGAYRYVDLSPHGGAAGMPGARVTAPGIAASGDAHTVEVLDLRQELRVANTSLISRRLHMELARALSQGERAVLLLNRRGAYTQQICARCGYVAQCFRCAMALTYHADEAALVCHYCNTSYVMNPDCPNCVNRRLQFVGAGTQRVEQELHQRFPSMRLARLDRDASKGPAADRAIVRRFAHGELDVLIGTRLLATPGLVPPTALVAVLNADVTLRLPDFQAAQETYELLYGIERCVEPGGRLLIQTYSPDHWVVQAIAAHDPAVYYREELRQRRTLGYPPFAQLVRLVRVHRDPTACRAQAEELAARLERRRVELRLDRAAVIGPAPAYFERLRGLSRWQLFLRGHGIAPLLDVIPRGWSIDVDPVTTL